MKKNTVAIIIIAVVVVVMVGVLFVMPPFPFNNTSKNTNTTFNHNTTNNTTANNSTVLNSANNNNHPPPQDISLVEAKELAQKYVGPDVTIGKPVLTTYKRIRVWQVPVYTMNHKFINNIYIDAKTGKKID